MPLTACENVPLESSDGGAAADGIADPDQALLDEAVRAEAEIVAMLTPMLRTLPARFRRAAQLTVAVHAAHLELLDGDLPVAEPSRRRTPTWRVVGAEEALARRHGEAAVRASSGQFARVLAGMAAAAAQQAEVWRRTTGTAS